MLPVSLDCPFLIASVVFSNVYLTLKLLLKCMYQTRKVSGHVDLYYGYQICLCFYISFIRFWNCSDCL